MSNRKIELGVGFFMLMAFIAILFICLKVAGITSFTTPKTYRLYAEIENIGGLKVRSPIKIGGVVIGRVGEIILDEETYLPRIALDIEDKYNHIPETSSLSIRTSGLLGEQYIDVAVGFVDEEMGMGYFKDGDKIQDTKSAMVLEDLIGKFLYKSGETSNATTEESTSQSH